MIARAKTKLIIAENIAFIEQSKVIKAKNMNNVTTPKLQHSLDCDNEAKESSTNDTVWNVEVKEEEEVLEEEKEEEEREIEQELKEEQDEE